MNLFNLFLNLLVHYDLLWQQVQGGHYLLGKNVLSFHLF